MSITAGDLIRRSLLEIGVIGKGEPLEADDAEDCLLDLNSMLNTLSTDGLMLYSLTQEQFNLVAAQVAYEIGEGATDFNTVRPERISKTSFIRDANGSDSPLEIITKDQYNALTDKTPGNGFPSQLYYEPSYPLGMIYFDYPSDGTHDLFLVSEKPFTEFTDLVTAVSFPAGYREMLIYNLAVRLTGPYRKALNQVTASIATSTMRAIQDLNAAQRPIRGRVRVPGAEGGGRSNIFTMGG